MKKDNNQPFQELWDSILFCVDSQRGKYSLETYLDIIGEYADRLIIKTQENGVTYTGGECNVNKDPDGKNYDFEVSLYFRDGEDNVIKKQASRKIAMDKFTRETKSSINDKKTQYKIDKPLGGKV